MASTGNGSDKVANTAIKHEGDHDRIAMASVRADGTLDQHNPEFIDQEFAQKATREQFAQQAVSANDDKRRQADASVETVEQDPEIAKRIAEDEKIEKAAHKAADSVVENLSPDKADSKS